MITRVCPLFSRGERKKKWSDKLQLQRVFAMTGACTGYIIIIKTHFHYTVDVWIGFWMTYFVWSYYHEAIKASPFHRGLLMRFLTWLEMHATDLRYWRIRVANQFVYDEELRHRGADLQHSIPLHTLARHNRSGHERRIVLPRTSPYHSAMKVAQNGCSIMGDVDSGLGNAHEEMALYTYKDRDSDGALSQHTHRS